MLKEKEIQEVILHTLDDLSQTIQASEKQSYTKEELLDLLGRVADFMTTGGAGEESPAPVHSLLV